jgi:hypothetical protein
MSWPLDDGAFRLDIIVTPHMGTHCFHRKG